MEPHSAITSAQPPRSMAGRRRAFITLLALGVLASLAVPSLSAATSPDPNTAQGVSISPDAVRGSFPDDVRGQLRIKLAPGTAGPGERGTKVVNFSTASDIVHARLVFQPGGSVGWHTHPGPALVLVTSGKLTIVNASDCVRREYRAGQAFVDPGQGNVHVGFNATAGETVVQATFLGVTPGSGPTIPMTHDHGHPCNL